MKKYTLLLSLLLLLIGSTTAQISLPLGRTQDQTSILQDDASTLHLVVSYGQLFADKASSSEGEFTQLLLQGGFTDGSVGQPQLPVTQRFIEIPFGASVTAKVNSFTTTELNLNDYELPQISPMQAPICKDILPDEAPFSIDRTVYQTNEYLGKDLVNVEVIGTLRGYHLARLTIAPVSYNPAQNTIRVCNDIDVEVSFSDADAALTRAIKAKTYSPYFDVVKHYLLNEGVSRDYPGNPDLTRYPVNYVIVADRMFDGELNDFIAWKTQKGFHVTLVFTDEIGSSYNQIQSYLHGLYNAATPDNPAPSFILFVGDTPQIPASIGLSSGKVTDVYYASVDGDCIPDMYYGRFSAQNVAQLRAQIEKTLYYEQFQFAHDMAYLNGVTLIAGWDDWGAPACGWPTVRYGQANWFNADHGYNPDQVSVYYGPDDYNGCYDDEKIEVSLINYTAHCSETVWGTPSLDAFTISGMTNEGRYPLAIGNCCESAQFGYGECVGESWVRAEKKGAVCYLGSAPSTYWYEDEWWAVGSYHITTSNEGQTPTYDQTTMGSYDAMHEGGYVSMGGLMLCGDLAVQNSANSHWTDQARYYWEAYNVLGDPSLIGYYGQPSALSVTYDPVINIGATSVTVQAPQNSFVALSKDGTLLGSGLVGEEGSINLAITSFSEMGFVDIVVTRPQSIPYIEKIPVGLAGQPFPKVVGHAGDPVNIAEATSRAIRIQNVGAAMSQPATVTVTSEDDNLMVLQGTTTIPALAHDEVYTIEPGEIIVQTSNDITDEQNFRLFATADCGFDAVSDFYFTACAPVFRYDSFEWSDGFIPGYSFDLTVNFFNEGHAAADGVIGYITCENPHVTIESDHYYYGHVNVYAMANLVYHIMVDETVSEGEVLTFDVQLQAHHGIEATSTVTLRNKCNLNFELRDSGGDGWNGAAVKIAFEDGSPQQQITLEEGSQNSFIIPVNKGTRVMFFWVKGDHDDQCGMTVTYDDGEVFFELPQNPHGNMLLTTVDCTVHPDEIISLDDHSLIVYPNPTSNTLHVVAPMTMMNCRLVNTLGQTVFNQSVTGEETTLQLEDLAPGLYLLQVNTEERTYLHKIVIK